MSAFSLLIRVATNLGGWRNRESSQHASRKDALQARIQSVAGEQREELGLALELGAGPVVLDDGLELGRTADRLMRSRTDVVDIIEVDDSYVRSSRPDVSALSM